MPAIIDAHCHLDFEQFDADRDQVLSDAMAAGVEHIIIPGVDINNWQRISHLCDDNDRLSACFGLHPYYVEQHHPQHLDDLKRVVTEHDCIAVGECGLDYRDGMADRELQHFYFSRQLEIAAELNKPVVIHSVRATEQVINTLKDFDNLRGMVHSYSGSYEQAMQLYKMGFCLSFGGAITYDRASRLRETVRKLPLQALLVETDAPDQVDASHQGQRNEPAMITAVIDTLCELRDEDRNTIIEQLRDNTRQLFNL